MSTVKVAPRLFVNGGYQVVFDTMELVVCQNCQEEFRGHQGDRDLERAVKLHAEAHLGPMELVLPEVEREQ